MNTVIKDQDVLNLIFGKEKQELSISNIIDNVNKNENARVFMRCLLQCSPQDP